MEKIINKLIEEIKCMPIEERVQALNNIRFALHEISPFKSEPVDLVLWIKNEKVQANDYNPNSVASTEMDLLKLSIEADGYTQPIVTMPENGSRTVIDGFHRHLVGKTYEPIQKRVLGYLPIVTINADRESREDRMAATVRHNRARGKHKVEAMSDIVLHLKRRNWNDKKIGKELGMDPEEVLRLTQITGLAELFKDREFSLAWEPELEEGGEDEKELS